MQLYPIGQQELLEPSKPTAGCLRPGDCFLRKHGKHARKFFYLVVNICGAIRYELKGDDGREIIIVNLATGTVFPIDPFEEIEPLPHAGIVEDVVKQKFKTGGK